MNSIKPCFPERGYILLEMILALAIFVIALAPLGRVINESLDAYMAVNNQNQLQTALINQTNLVLASRLKVGTFKSLDEDGGIQTIITVDPYEQNIEPETLISNVFHVTVSVSDKSGNLISNFYLRKLDQ